MGEFLRLWFDFPVMAKVLPIGQLNHYFGKVDPTKSKALHETMVHFRMRELEASDYRSAYHQFSDWLYGWSVSDGKEFDINEINLRPARDINMVLDREKQDAARLMNTFETLTSITLRHLKVLYGEIDKEFPLIGSGLETMTNNAQTFDEMENLTATTANKIEKVWGTKVGATEREDSHEKLEEMYQTVDEEYHQFIDSNSANPAPKSSDGIPAVSTMPSGTPEETSPRRSFVFAQPPSENTKPASSENSKSPEQSTVEPPAEVPVPAPRAPLIEIEDPKIAIQRDVNHVFLNVDKSTEYSLVALSSIAAVLSFAELLGERAAYAKASHYAHELSQDFISNTLKTVWDLLNIEIPQSATLSGLRNPAELKVLINQLLALRAVNGNVPKFRVRKLYQKFAALHECFLLFDIHIFPNFANVHKEGLRCAQPSAFDSYLWLTGGNDCVIRITDIRAQNRHMCLGQYIGHKSIISDVKFTHNDNHIVSASYDRTIKVWNSQTALVEKTLVGHVDAVTSCDISSDGRYIASGSLDCTIKLWDFTNGENVATVKKHSKWVKCVRFSHDGRYLASAGLDRRVYVWDTKILVNSKSPSHNRCLDNFHDYVLDMVLFKPNLMITTSRDSTLRLFDYLMGHELKSFNLAPSWACTLSLSANEEYFATGSFDNNINIFRTSDFVRIREIRAFNLGIMAVRFPADLSYLAVGTAEGFLQQIEL